MKKILTFICAAAASLSVSAQTMDNPWNVGLYGGRTEYAGEYGHDFLNIGADFYGHGALTFSRYINRYFDATFFASYGKYGAVDHDKVEFESAMGYGDLTLKYKFIRSESALFRPFVFLGVGGRYLMEVDENPNCEPGFSMVIPAGLGCDLRLSERFSLRYIATYGYGLSDDQDKRDCGSYGDQQLLHSLGLAYSFTFNGDRDNDGIPNKQDECPDTPEGVQVDEKGCPLDTDKDGVYDYLDKCPGTPAEAAGTIDSTGCPIDTDGDGVADFLDKCPDTPAEAAGKVDDKGCPLDSDGDGVVDYLDQCEGTPAAAAGKVDDKGCPIDSDGDGVADFEDKCPAVVGIKANKGCPEIKEEVKQVFQKALNGIEFQTGKATIKKSSNKILDQIVTIMNENPAYLLLINGHTDNVGKADKNLTLSNDRANAVKTYLVNKGVDEKRMTAKGFGQEKPVADNKTAAGRAKNRRVEFVVEF